MEVKMLQVGDTKTEIKQFPSGRHCVKLVWDDCPKCGKERFVRVARKGMMCRDCLIKKLQTNPSLNWKGGRTGNGQGYILIWLPFDDFFYPMADKRSYVLEHRLVMAKHLGRCLHRWEIVHHKNGVPKNDNRINGLQLVSDDRHKQITILENKIHSLEQRILSLEVENIVLKGEYNKIN